ncbi:MAG: hypothetical protein ABIJ47_14650 [Candidatus Bathyarchaeota archaeon]
MRDGVGNNLIPGDIKNVPTRSKGEIIIGVFVIVVASYDLYLTFKLSNFYQLQLQGFQVSIAIMVVTISLMLYGHLKVSYLVSGNYLLIYQSFGSEKINLHDVKGFNVTKLGLLHQILWGLIPTFTVAKGVMIELKQGKRVFISPKDPEVFLEQIQTYISKLGTDQ